MEPRLQVNIFNSYLRKYCTERVLKYNKKMMINWWPSSNPEIRNLGSPGIHAPYLLKVDQCHRSLTCQTGLSHLGHDITVLEVSRHFFFFFCPQQVSQRCLSSGKCKPQENKQHPIPWILCSEQRHYQFTPCLSKTKSHYLMHSQGLAKTTTPSVRMSRRSCGQKHHKSKQFGLKMCCFTAKV